MPDRRQTTEDATAPPSAGPQTPSIGPEPGESAGERGNERGWMAQDVLLSQLGRASVPLLLLLLAGIGLGIRQGFGGLAPIFLIVGSVASAAAMFFYALPSVILAYGRKPRRWMAVAGLGGFIPYIFGLAVIFAVGMVRPLVELTLLGAVAGVFFIIVGFWYLRDYSRLTAIGKRIDDLVIRWRDRFPPSRSSSS